MSVGDDSDYGERVSIALELAVDGALTGPDGFGGGLGDDCVFLRAIVLVEWRGLRRCAAARVVK